jgi:hypothetical protein
VNLADHIRKFPRRRGPGFLSRGFQGKLAHLALLLALIASSARSAEPQTRQLTASEPGLKFAIADLDGDLRPDLAYVETGRSNVSLTDYWIRLQITAGQAQSILIVAPTGGLQIVARDVNGDQAPDLVLTTAWLRQPVAILLNNGHGVFSQADPKAFPSAFCESRGTRWDSSTGQAPAIIGYPPQSRLWGLWAGVRLPAPRSLDDTVPGADCGFVRSRFCTSHLARAPPSELLSF